MLTRLQVKYHIHISPFTKIGYRLYLGYAEFITIAQNAKIGNNLNINHGAVIGKNNRGKKRSTHNWK